MVEREGPKISNHSKDSDKSYEAERTVIGLTKRQLCRDSYTRKDSSWKGYNYRNMGVYGLWMVERVGPKMFDHSTNSDKSYEANRTVVGLTKRQLRWDSYTWKVSSLNAITIVTWEFKGPEWWNEKALRCLIIRQTRINHTKLTGR